MQEYLTKKDIKNTYGIKTNGSTTVTGTISSKPPFCINESSYKQLIGRIIYDFSFNKLEFSTCPWILYPLYRCIVKLTQAKCNLYEWLNRKGVMHTPEGNIARLSDIWRK